MTKAQIKATLEKRVAELDEITDRMILDENADTVEFDYMVGRFEECKAILALFGGDKDENIL